MDKTKTVRVAITMDDDSVAIMSFATFARGPTLPYGATWTETEGYWSREPSDANLFHEISRTFATGPQPVRYRMVRDADIPDDREYRNALRDDGTRLYHDMPKAREIHLANLRRQRTTKLEELDREWMKAVGQKDKKATYAIEAKRQVLRDLPANLGPTVAMAVNTDELKTIRFDG
jgi:hypothetical protein